MEQIIEKTLCYVKEYFENESSGHDYFHTLRVYKMAKILLQKKKQIKTRSQRKKIRRNIRRIKKIRRKIRSK